MTAPKKPAAKAAPAKLGQAAGVPDQDAMKAFLTAHGAAAAEEKTDEAQSLIYDAADCKTARARINLARKALAISPLCADAYVLLADEEAQLDSEKRDYFGLGVTAGELALGKRRFREDAGSFWGFLETRPYMRARSGLAHTMVRLGDIDGAIGHFWAMLALNPNDNQGLRYSLLACLLQQNEDRAATALLEKYEDDDSPFWSYGRLLLTFRAGQGAAAATMDQLQAALESNPHVPAILAGAKRKVSLGGYMTAGGADEATYYVEECEPAWRRTPGAVEWLADLASQARRPRKPRGAARP